MQMKKLVSQVSRTGRDLQRYNFQGCRQVVGCIPYRLRNNEESLSINGVDQLEFLLISSQKSSKWMFPKGGWEKDESIEEAAVRETMEEAGVLGVVGNELGCWTFKSKSQDKYREGYMLSFRVTDELDVWSEKDYRKRIWVSASEAREKCEYLWMKLALDSFICQMNHEEHKVLIFSDSVTVNDPSVDTMDQSEEEGDLDCHDLSGDLDCHDLSGDLDCHVLSRDLDCRVLSGDLDCHVLSLTQLKEENYMTPYLIRLFTSNEPSICIVAQAQLTHLQLIKEEERVKPCCLDFLKSKQSRFVIQEDAIIS